METHVLSRRLDRLRQAPARPAVEKRPRIDHGARLASELGGHATRGIAVFDATADVAIDREALAALPFGVPLDAPLLCFDLETTGLATAAGTLAFLVGLGWWDGDLMHVRQLLLPDHADERSLLDLLTELITPETWLVTYNGRSFDWPLIVARYRLHGRPPPLTAGHLDLLPIARQLWKHRLGSARLATVEAGVCGVRREGDLSGAFIPDRFFSYLRSRQGILLRDVLDHNRQDIVSLGLLVSELSTGGLDRFQPGDLFGLSRAYARRKSHADALRVVDHALRPDAWTVRRPTSAVMHRQLSAERARLLSRLGRREDAIEAWLEIARRGGPGAAVAWLQVARYREHAQRDIVGAQQACHEAASVAGRARAWGEPMHAVERDLERRLPRLTRLNFRKRRLNRVA